MMTAIVLLLMIGALLLLISPFVYDFGFRIYEKSSINIDLYADLFIRKESLLSALSDLNQDNEAGKLLPEDFAAIKSEIIGELRAIDGQLSGEDFAKFENQSPAAESADEVSADSKNQTLSRFCHSCGFKLDNTYTFCPKCGTKAVAVS